MIFCIILLYHWCRWHTICIFTVWYNLDKIINGKKILLAVLTDGHLVTSLKLTWTLFKQIVNNEFHSLRYVLPAKRDTQRISRLRLPTVYPRTNQLKNLLLPYCLSDYQWRPWYFILLLIVSFVCLCVWLYLCDPAFDCQNATNSVSKQRASTRSITTQYACDGDNDDAYGFSFLNRLFTNFLFGSMQ